MTKDTVEQINHNICTGCMMCGDICPKGAISFKIESDGFWYPSINDELCIHCGRCYNKCPQLIDISKSIMSIPKCFGAKTKNEDIRWQSTSGGFFSELSSAWISSGGLCVGAEYDNNCNVCHCIEKDISGIDRLRQSKYVQSKTSGIYRCVQEALSSGKSILFSGTPCQVEALLCFLEKKYDNLLTMDFVCCGICSPGIYNKYLKMLEKKYHSKIKKVWFKNKSAGWRSIGTRVEFENGKVYFRTGNRDLFMLSFVTDALSMRECCENCKYRTIPHNSDLTIADFWGIEFVNPSFDDDKGVSAIFVNTEKGSYWFDKIKQSLDYFETTINDIARKNYTVYKPKNAHQYRKEFFDCVNNTSFENAMNIYSSYRGFNKIKTNCTYWIRFFLKSIIGYVRR